MVILDKILEKLGYVNVKSWEQLWASALEGTLFGEISKENAYKKDLSVYKGIKAITDNIPQAELVFKRWNDDVVVYPQNWIDLFNRPNPLMTYHHFIKSVAGCIALDGGVFIVKTDVGMGRLRSPSSMPRELWIFRVKDGKAIIEDGVFKGYEIRGTRYQVWEVAFPRDFNPDNMLEPTSGLEAGKNILEMDFEAQRHNVNFFKHGGTPGIVVETEQSLSDIQREAIKKQLNAKIQGSRKSFMTLVLEKGLKIKAFTPSHKEMDFVEQLKYTREEILGIWRVPKALLNITDDLNYATFLGQIKAFWQYSLMPLLRMIEDAINYEIIYPVDRSIYCEFDISKVPAFREDFKEQVEIAKSLYSLGFTANEINEYFGWGFESKPWRDSWWIPISQVPAGESVIGDVGKDSKGKRSIKKEVSDDWIERKEIIHKAFLMRHTPIERAWEKKLSRFFFEQRQEILEKLNEKGIKGLEDSIDWDEQDKKLIKYSISFIEQAVEGGMKFGLGVLGADPSPDLEHKARSLISSIAQQITRVNQTVKRQLQRELLEGIREGETTTQLADRVRNVYNMAANRSMTIARTETTRAMNGGASLYYEDVGVEKKQWLTAGDEAVRELHQMVDGEIREMGQMFSNGLMFPGDPNGSPENTINCRCTIVPVI